MQENQNKDIIKKNSSLFNKINIFDYFGAILFISGPILTLIRLYAVDAINQANKASIEYDLMMHRTPYIATVSLKTYVFAILLSFIGYVLLSWGRKR